jgi:hypothetical protein
VFGTFKKEYDTSRNLLQTTKSWGVGADVQVILFSVHFNLDIGYKNIE